MRKAGGKESVTTDTVFEAASLGKPVLAYVILRLRDTGGIDFERSLLKYMPFPDARGEPLAKLVTARHVLTHRTGLPNCCSNGALTFEFTPGEHFGYSGAGYFWLQRVLEHITAIPFARYMRENVLEPCGMKNSSFVLLRDMLENCAVSHPARASAISSPTWIAPNAASSMLTTAGDYARFMTRFMPGRSRDQFDLLEPTRREMLTPQSPLNHALSHGLGWSLEQEDGATSFRHSGLNRGFKNVALADAGDRMGIVLLTNSHEGDRLRWPIVHAFTGRGGAASL